MLILMDTVGNFILRVHSLDSVTIKHVNPLYSEVLIGEWRRSGDSDTTGGPLTVFVDGQEKENPKWCQNPQIHFQVRDPYSDEELHIKIVAKRTDKLAAQKNALASGAGGLGGDKTEAKIGLVVCKAEYLEDRRPTKSGTHSHGPRKNAYGEVRTLLIFTLHISNYWEDFISK